MATGKLNRVLVERVRRIPCGYCGREGPKGGGCLGCGATIEPFPDRLPRSTAVAIHPAWAKLLQPDLLFPLIAAVGGLLYQMGLFG